MNIYSIGRRAALAGVLALGTGCGGDSDGAVSTKAEWQRRHGPVVAAVSTDLDEANQALSSGQRLLIISSCTQLQDDLAEAREGLPVPDPAVDTALRDAFDAIEDGVPVCLEGARLADRAHLTETAIDKLAAARPKLDEARRSIADWQP